MKVVTIVQARMSSTRLPGKVLAAIGGRSMLERVCRRAGRAALVDDLIVATTVEPADDPVAAECRRLGISCFRGSEQDVLDRFYHAAQACGADLVVRVTADCPLIDPGLIDEVVSAVQRQRPDFASNVLRRTYPRGLDTEAATVEALTRAWRNAVEPYERVHVMPHIYRNPHLFRLFSVTGPDELGDCRWTVDSPDDLAFVRAVYRRLPGDDAFAWRDVLRVLEREPALADMNRHVRQKQLAEG
jgi:spore coat polysaccharide biosynthesis protein SpsF